MTKTTTSSTSIEKTDRIQQKNKLDAKIKTYIKTLRVIVITEAIVCFAAFGVGALSVYASLSGMADQAAAETGVSAEMLGGNSAGWLMGIGGGLLIAMALCGFLTVILGKNTLDDQSYAASFTVMSFVTLILSITALIVSILNGSFIANTSIMVISVVFSLNCVRAGLKMRNMYLERNVLS